MISPSWYEASGHFKKNQSKFHVMRQSGGMCVKHECPEKQYCICCSGPDPAPFSYVYSHTEVYRVSHVSKLCSHESGFQG